MGKFFVREPTKLFGETNPAMKFAQTFRRVLFFLAVCCGDSARADSKIQLTVNPTVVSFNAPEGVVTATEALFVGSTDWGGIINATIAYVSGEPGWLQLIESAPRTYRIKVFAANLSAGRYGAIITLSSSAPAQAVDVPVTLTIGLGILLPAVR